MSKENKAKTAKQFDSEMIKIDLMIEDLAGDFKGVVSDIEKRIKTTQNRYGDYLDTLSLLMSKTKEKDNTSLYIYSTAMIKAGGNKQGILSAVKILRG